MHRIDLEGAKLTLNLTNIFGDSQLNCSDGTSCDVILDLVTQIWGKYIAVGLCGPWFALEEADEEIQAEINPCGLQVWFSERQVEVLNKNKECTSLRGEEGWPWRQNKGMN